jgi:hypothetical protein
MTLNDFGMLMLVVSRLEVESGDTSGPLSTLKHLISSQQMIRDFRTRVDIAFDGYNETPEELFEITQVRNYVYALDEQFPYWLYFLSRDYPGLQCITLCFLPPYLTDEARARIHPQRLGDLIERRWGPALNHICTAAGFPQSEADALLESAFIYYKHGPLISFLGTNKSAWITLPDGSRMPKREPPKVAVPHTGWLNVKESLAEYKRLHGDKLPPVH